MLGFVVTALTILVSTAVLSVVYYSRSSFNYWKNKNVYTLEPTVFFGNAKDVILQKKFFGSDLVELYNNIKSSSRKFGGYYMSFKPIFVPTDLDLIKKIFISDFNYFTDRISHVDDHNDPLSANILFLHGDRWKQVRQLLRPVFSSKTINSGMVKLERCTENLLSLVERRIKLDGYLDIKVVLDKYNIDVIGSILVDVECNALNSDYTELEKNIDSVLETSIIQTTIRFLFLVPIVKNYVKLSLFNKQITKFFVDFVQKYKNDTNGVIRSLTANSKPLSNNEIAANVAMLFLAGYDTTSNTTAFCMYELALNPLLQESVRNEINSVLIKHGDVLNNDALADLELLEKCLRETLRKYPVSTVLTRTCVQTYTVPDSDIILEKGSQIYIPVRAVHWDPDLYPNPEVFNPERFSEEEIRQRHSAAWLPFGVGSRHCIGNKLAKISMKISVAQLLKNYRFSVHPDTKHPLQFDQKAYLLQAKDNIKLCVIKLNY